MQSSLGKVFRLSTLNQPPYGTNAFHYKLYSVIAADNERQIARVGGTREGVGGQRVEKDRLGKGWIRV